jgi:hypothetical protein
VLDRQQQLRDVADLVRAKNAGPFWITLDVFLPSDEAYARVAADSVITPDVVGRLYAVDPASVKIFRIPLLRVIKISFPRRTPQAGFRDRDVHSGQQHIPLQNLPIAAGPARTPSSHDGSAPKRQGSR